MFRAVIRIQKVLLHPLVWYVAGVVDLAIVLYLVKHLRWA